MTRILVPGVDRDIDADIRRRWNLKPGDPVPVSLENPTRSWTAADQKAKVALTQSKRIDRQQVISGAPNEKYVLINGKYRRNPKYDPPYDITLGQAMAIPPLVGAAAAALPAAATFVLGGLKAARKAQNLESKIAEYLDQGFNPVQAERLASPYTGRGHHYVPKNRKVTLIDGLPPLKGLPAKISESRFNVLKPKGMSFGDFYKLHYKVDPSFKGARLPGPGPGWSGKRLGLEKYDKAGRLWHGSPKPLKIAAGGSVGSAAAGSVYLLSEDEK